MGLVWTIVGLITGLSTLAFIELAKRYRLDWKAWSGLAVGEFLLLFCIAWSAASVAEGVPRSASMGLIMFGGAGRVTLILTWRLFIDGNEVGPETEATAETIGPNEVSDTENQSGTDGSSRREFFGQSLLQAIGLKQAAIASTAAVGAAGAATVAIIKSSGKPLDDVPNEISDDYKPFDQRQMVFTFIRSKKLQEQYPERVQAWEKRAHERGKDFFKVATAMQTQYSKEPDNNTPGYQQIDYALMNAAWHTNNTQSGASAFGQPGQGVYTFDQSDVAEQQWKFDTESEAATHIKSAAKLFGAVRCGITRNDERWNYDPIYDPIEDKELSWEDDFPFKPKTVIVLLIQQDYFAMSTAPAPPASAASGQGYSEMTVVAGQLAKFIRLLGYQAVGSGNDLGLSVPYAVAAGLGENSRAGWLIAPGLGPNIRICKVYTDLDFIEYDQPRDYSITNFCVHCKRCADACPSQAITHDPLPTLQPQYEGADDPDYGFTTNKGVLKWHSDHKKCYEYWVESGSSCAACVATCPYNKPDFWHHDLVDTANVITPGPLHYFMKEMDKVFGYGVTNDPEKTKAFWKTGEEI
jgi:epoxyqueuosine reductase